MLLRLSLKQRCIAFSEDGVKFGAEGAICQRVEGNAFHLQPHSLPDVLHRRAAVGNHLVVVFLEIEIWFLLRRCAQIEMLSGADEISGKLSGSETCTFPLRHSFAFLL